jgi:hypothetical protein
VAAQEWFHEQLTLKVIPTLAFEPAITFDTSEPELSGPLISRGWPDTVLLVLHKGPFLKHSPENRGWKLRLAEGWRRESSAGFTL